MIKVRPIRNNDEVQTLIERAAADDHVVIGATHLLIKRDEIVGYLSLGGVTHVHNWFDSKEMTASDSVIAIAQGEAILASNGVKEYIIACGNSSPFLTKMGKLGFKEMFATTLYTKET